MKYYNSKITALCLMLTLQILSGCKVGPNYRRPELADQGCVIDSAIAQEAVVESEEIEPNEWWQIFGDPQLEQYIYESAEYNLDVKMAACRIIQAKAQRRIAAAQLYPYFDGKGAYDHYFIGTDLRGLFPPTSHIPPSALKDIDIDLSSYGFNLNWEIDLFGRIRRQVESACYQIGAAIEDRRDILVSVFSEVARNYLQIRGYQAQIEVVRDSLEALQLKQELIELRRNTGVDSEIQLSQVQSEVETLRSQLPPLIAEFYTSIYRLSVLTGRSANALVPEFCEVKPLPRIPEVVSAGLCCRLLERRPDVRFAERQLAAATADMGVAEAQLYPNISLKGFLGFLTIDTEIFKANNVFALSAGAGALAPLFHGGELIANLKGAQARASEVCFHYEQTVLTAIQEVESAIAVYAKQKEAYAKLHNSQLAMENVFLLTNELYEKGVRSQISWAEAKYSYLTMKNSVIQSQVAALVDLTQLYKALGGGWQISP